MELAGVPRQVNVRVAKQVNASGLEPDSLTGLRVRVPPRAFSITFDTILQLDARAMNQYIDLISPETIKQQYLEQYKKLSAALAETVGILKALGVDDGFDVLRRTHARDHRAKRAACLAGAFGRLEKRKLAGVCAVLFLGNHKIILRCHCRPRVMRRVLAEIFFSEKPKLCPHDIWNCMLLRCYFSV